MELRVKPSVAFMPKADIEAVADLLLKRYQNEVGLLKDAPIPIEFITEDFLGFTLRWDELAENDTLAFIDPNKMEICFNLGRSDYFDQIGPEYCMAHEVGHYELGHFQYATIQLELGLMSEPKRFLHREIVPSKYGSHEFQAEYFAASLLMPKWLLLKLAKEYDLLQWSGIYSLADKFNVSATAMSKRLEELKLIYRDGKKLYRSEQEATGQLPLL